LRPRQGSRPAAAAALSHGEALAAALPALLVAAERVAATVWQGVHGRRRVGQGEAFWQFRRYQAEDPPQRIDWKRSAKSDHAYVRQTEWEAAESVYLWRDGSASMDWRSVPAWPAKIERAGLLLLALAALLARGGEQFALLNGEDPPRRGRTGLLRIAGALASDEAAPNPSLPERQAVPRHARVVLLGDFLSPLDAIRSRAADYAGQGVGGVLVQVLDPAEETLPFAGRVLFTGCERDGEVLFGRVEDIRDAYRDAMARHQQALAAIARSFGWTLIRHRTDQPPNQALLAMYAALSAPRRG
jgi:uncharacterized protein (DUF58 family)